MLNLDTLFNLKSRVEEEYRRYTYEWIRLLHVFSCDEIWFQCDDKKMLRHNKIEILIGIREKKIDGEKCLVRGNVQMTIEWTTYRQGKQNSIYHAGYGALTRGPGMP